nr:zinc finger, CCHC-type [Tanacetum cinerariifolium]
MPSSNEDQIGETPIENPTTRRSYRARVAKSFGYDFQLYLVDGSRDKIEPQYSYCYSIKEDPRTFDEAMQSCNVALWKEAINDEMDSIFKRKTNIDGTIDKFKARLVIQGSRQKEGIDYFDTYAPVARISIIRLLIALAATYNLVIHQMDVKTTFLNGDLEEEVPKQWHQKFNEVVFSSRLVLNQSNKCVYYRFDKSSNRVIIFLYVDDMLISETNQDQVDKTKEFLSSNFSMKDIGEGLTTPLDPTIKLMPNTGRAVDQLEYSRAIGYSNASWITNSEDHTPTTGWVFLLSGGTISWASKKPTCITDSTMEAEFVALAAAGKEAEWLRNLIYEISLWPRPISPMSIHCDSAATLAKAYCQIYNEKARHLDVRHSMVCALITNGVISVDFVRFQQNMTDHLTKGLARDLVHKSDIGMGLECIEISNDETPDSLPANVGSRIQCGQLIFSDWNTFNSIIPRCKNKRTSYVSIKFCRFKKLWTWLLYSHQRIWTHGYIIMSSL